MWQRFTERSRRVIFFSQEEAGKLGESYVSSEHILLGLVRENDSLAATILDRMGVPPDTVRAAIERQVVRGNASLNADMQLTARAKRVVDLAYEEARSLENNYIGTEHLLLGLMREGEGLAARILIHLGLELQQTRVEVLLLQLENALNDNSSQARNAILGRLRVIANELREREPEVAESIQQRILEAEGLPPSEAQTAGIRGQNVQAATRDVLLQRMRSLALQMRGQDPALGAALLQGLEAQAADEYYADFGDIGVARSATGRTRIEVTLDAGVFLNLIAVYAAKDTLGYRAMASGDQTMFLLPVGTPLKLLVVPPGGEQAAAAGGRYIRVLSGEYEGYAGWVLRETFERTGPDEAPFPPEDEEGF